MSGLHRALGSCAYLIEGVVALVVVGLVLAWRWSAQPFQPSDEYIDRFKQWRP